MATEDDLRAAFALLEDRAPQSLPLDSADVTDVRWGDVGAAPGSPGHGSGGRRAWVSKRWLVAAAAAVVVGLIVLASTISSLRGHGTSAGGGVHHSTTRSPGSVNVPCDEQKCPSFAQPYLDPLLRIDGHLIGNAPFAVRTGRRLTLLVFFKGNQPRLASIDSITVAVTEYSGARPTPITMTSATSASGMTLSGTWTAERIAVNSDAVVVNVNFVYKSAPGTTGGSGASYPVAQLRIVP